MVEEPRRKGRYANWGCSGTTLRTRDQDLLAALLRAGRFVRWVYTDSSWKKEARQWSAECWKWYWLTPVAKGGGKMLCSPVGSSGGHV